jgi:RHS repeat-associated protein
VTRSGSAVELLVDEGVVDTDTVAGALHDNDIALVIGANASAGGLFEGKIDEVRISAADTGESLSTLEVNYRYNARNQLTVEYAGPEVTEETDPPADVSVKTYTYDRNGNVTDIVETVGATEVSREGMAYDELNRMLEHTGPNGTESFTYRGAEWHRYSADGTSFLYDGDNVLADVGAGGVDAFYVTPFLDQNLSITNTAGTHYYSQDGLGSVRTLTNATGVMANNYDYLPFGGPHVPGTSVTVEQRHTYAGRAKNPSSRLMYYRYRPYDPQLGWMLNRNPWGYIQLRMSLYDAMMARPVTHVEPFSGTAAATAAAGASVGTGSAAVATIAGAIAGGVVVVIVEEAFRRTIKGIRCFNGLARCRTKALARAGYCAQNWFPNSRLDKTSRLYCEVGHHTGFMSLCLPAFSACIKTWFGSFPMPAFKCRVCPCVKSMP